MALALVLALLLEVLVVLAGEVKEVHLVVQELLDKEIMEALVMPHHLTLEVEEVELAQLEATERLQRVEMVELELHQP
jgi:hypothetical protein